MPSALKRLTSLAALATILAVFPAHFALAQHEGGEFVEGDLLVRINSAPGSLEQIFPGAEELEWVEGRPPALAAKIGGEILGYIFSTRDTVNATGYAGIAFDLVAGVDLDGNVTGAALLYHREAIIGRGVEQETMEAYVAGFAAATITNFKTVKPDMLVRATVSGRLMRNGVRNAANLVYNQHVMGGVGPITEPMLDRDGFYPLTWEELVQAGSIAKFHITNLEAVRLFRDAAGEGARPNVRMSGGAGGEFITLLHGLMTPASIGANILGDRRFRQMLESQDEGGFMFYMAADGNFSFASNSHFRAANNHEFDQFYIAQNGNKFVFTRDRHNRMSVGRGPALNHKDLMLFYLAGDSGFDPLAPWEVVLRIPGTDPDKQEIWVEHAMQFSLPDKHKLLPPPPPTPEWVEAWTAAQTDLSVLAGLLMAVTLIFVFQDALVKRRQLYTVVRVGVLAFTMAWLGFWAGGQLSVVNVMAYLQAPFIGANLTSFVLDPLLFVLAVYTAITMFVIGRGVFCGWLCPFGALQELLNRAAQLIRLPQVRIPPTMLERLWVLKYLIAIAILGLGFVSINTAEQVAEVEPFKTVVTVKLDREWPFVMYALLLLGIGLFIERAYCRVLCPLGGSLAILGRIRMFNWLKRKPQCGTECRICENDCPLGAISPSGQINLNECLQCLDCQADYYDNTKCPPLIARRKRREARAKGLEGDKQHIDIRATAN